MGIPSQLKLFSPTNDIVNGFFNRSSNDRLDYVYFDTSLIGINEISLNVGPFHVQPQSGLHDCEYEFDLQKSTIMNCLIVGTSPSIVIEDQVIYTQQFTSFNLGNETVCNGEPRDEKIRAGDISNFSALLFILV